MPRTCTKCQEAHEPPKNSNCNRHIQATLASLAESLATVSSRLDSMEARASDPASTRRKPPQPDNNSSSESEDDIRMPPASETRAATITPSRLKSHKRVQSFVDKRMQELGVMSSDDELPTSKPSGKGRSQRSGRVKTASDFVVKQVEWPHYHIFRGPSRQPASYDELTISEFVFGYLTSLEQEVCPNVRAHKLQHLRELMMDTCEFGWQGPRNYHGIILQEMEKGRLSWDPKHASRMGEMRQQYSHTNTNREGTQAAASKGSVAATSTPMVCYAFQKGGCKQEGDHSNARGHCLHHSCQYCLKKTGNKYPHAEKDCKRKNWDGDQGKDTASSLSTPAKN